MLCEDIFFRLPVRDTYRETKHHAVFLRAHPTVARICFVIEVIVCVAIFAYSYHITANTATTDTKISFEALDASYDCEVLSPRSNSEAFNVKTSDAVFFSKARFNYETCTATLDSTGLNVCSDDVRQDYLLNVVGMESDAEHCYDVILEDGYRFCYNLQSMTELEYKNHREAFTKRNTPYMANKASFYFTKGDGDIIEVTADFDPTSTTSILSDFVSDLKSNVYVVAADSTANQRATLFKFSPSSSTASKLFVPSLSSMSGIAYGDQAVFMYEIANAQGKIFTYNTTKNTDSVFTVSCSDFGNAVVTNGASTRYISFGSDNNVYVMCNGETVYQKASNTPPPGSTTIYKQFDFFQVNMKTLTSVRFGANLNAVNYTIDGVQSTQSIDEISQVFQSRGNFYFVTKNHNNIIRGDMAKITAVSGVQVVRKDGLSFQVTKDGDYITNGRSSNIYFPGGSYRYFDTTTKTLKTYTDLGIDSYYAVAVELGFSYQVCNGNITNYSIDYETSTSFYSSCQSLNGIYYQSNNFITIPDSCRGAINSTDYAYDLLKCTEVEALRSQYITSTCQDSIDKVCTAEFTDNPPFSCSKDTYPTFITTIATAFANASGVWTFVVIFLKLVLKIHYPHGYHDFDYDEETERFIPHGFKVEYPEIIQEAFGSKREHHDAAIHPVTSEEGNGGKLNKEEEDDQLRHRNGHHLGSNDLV